MLLERVARRELRFFAFAFALRSQRVDGRRLDAFVADLHCSRVHRGAAPTVSYVSALTVRVQMCMCASLPVACVGVLVGVPVFVRVCACVLGCKALKEGGEVQPNRALRATSASTV